MFFLLLLQITGEIPPGFNMASLQVPDSRMKLLVSLVLLDWKFQNSDRFHPFLMKGKTKQKHVLRQIC